jgi:O-antigen/teichoic acid export membrane protein
MAQRNQLAASPASPAAGGSLFAVAIQGTALTGYRVLCGFAIAKVVAVTCGPAGLAVMGQLQNAATMLAGLASAPGGSGLVRFTSRHAIAGYSACAPWWRAVGRMTVATLIVLMCAVVLLADDASRLLFATTDSSRFLLAAAALLPLAVANTLVASVLNGLKRQARFMALSAIGVTVGSACIVAGTLLFGLEGAMFGVVAYSAICGLAMIAGVAREPWARLNYWWGRAGRAAYADIGRHVAMTITSAICAPVSLMLVRTLLADRLGWEATGQWQAVQKISEVYLAAVTVALTSYYLPQLSALRGRGEVDREVRRALALIVPCVGGFGIVLYLARDLVIAIAFSSSFAPARDLFAAQLIGDVTKIASWVFAYVMIARGATRWYVTTEIVFSMTLVALAWWFVGQWGLEGAVLAYAVNYGLYLVAVMWVQRRICATLPS